MPKAVKINGVCYERVAPNSFYEDEIERYILIHSPYLYPDHHVLPFKLLVSSPDGQPDSARADLVFIAKNYSEWWIVEIEMLDHSLEGHIIPQMQTLYFAEYGEREAKYIHNKEPSLELDRLTSLIKECPPGLLVIANGQPPGDWIGELKRFNVQVSSFEIFRCIDQQDEIFVINGSYVPKSIQCVVTDCIFEQSFGGLLRLHDPEALSIKTRETVMLHHHDSISEWRRIEARNEVWLEPVNRSAIPYKKKAKYQIVRHMDNSLGLIIIDNEGI